MAKLASASLQSAYNLLYHHCQGVLATQSIQFPDYPHNSLVPYYVDGDGIIVVLLSRLAMHTHNIQNNPKVAFFVMQEGCEDVQTAQRISLSCDVKKVLAHNVQGFATCYYKHFPRCRGYHSELDFDFYQFHIKQVSYIGGFGRVEQFTAEQWLNDERLPKTTG